MASSDRGLQLLEKILGLRHSETQYAYLDVIFVSIDLERGRIDEHSTVAPPIREFGIATLDTRHLFHDSATYPTTNLISTQQFSTRYSSASAHYAHLKGCGFPDFQECLFADTHYVSLDNIPRTIINSLRIQDTQSLDPTCLRNVVLVGHSIEFDLQVLLRLGIYVPEIAPVVAVLDTYAMSRAVLRRPLAGFKDLPAVRGFSLGGVLEKLQCPFQPHELHNAGNDATYTLHAMLMLAIRSSRERGLVGVEAANLEGLDVIVHAELDQCQEESIGGDRGDLCFLH